MDRDYCFLCASSNVNFLKRRKDVNIYCCTECAIVFGISSHREQRDRENIIHTDPKFYENVKKEYDRQFERSKIIISKRLNLYREYLGRYPKNVLEIGCGTGVSATAFESLNVKYYGIDAEKEIVDFGIKQGNRIENVNLFDLENSKWDVIFLSQVIEHVENPMDFMKKIRNLLSDDGILHLDCPNHNSIAGYFRKIFHNSDYGFIQPYYHMIAYSKKSIKNLMNLSKFELIYLENLSNNHMIWGQFVNDGGVFRKLKYFLLSVCGGGSLTVCVSKKIEKII